MTLSVVEIETVAVGGVSGFVPKAAAGEEQIEVAIAVRVEQDGGRVFGVLVGDECRLFGELNASGWFAEIETGQAEPGEPAEDEVRAAVAVHVAPGHATVALGEPPGQERFARQVVEQAVRKS